MADVIQLCAAVQTAHEADLLHRDIKPDNALVDAFGRIKLADFGIAAVTGSTLTATGMVTATIAHAAPEVLNGGRATFPSDVYPRLHPLRAAGREPAFVRDTDESIVPLVLRVTADTVPDLRAQGVPAPIAEASSRPWPRTPPTGRPPPAPRRELQSAQPVLGLKVTDLPVRGDAVPPPRHDDTVMGAVAAVPSARRPGTDRRSSPGARRRRSGRGRRPPEAGRGRDGRAHRDRRRAHRRHPGPGPGRPVPGEGTERSDPAGKAKKSRLPLVLAVLVVIGLGAAAFFLLGQGDDGRQR